MAQKQCVFFVGFAEDEVFAQETCERKNSGDGERGDEHRPIGDGDFFGERAHLAHVLFAGERVDHAAGGEK